MTRQATKEELLAWQERWALVNGYQRDELCRKSPDDRMRDLAALMLIVREFGWEKILQEDDDAARAQWLKLYKAYGVC